MPRTPFDYLAVCSWKDDTCPACVDRAIKERNSGMSDAERQDHAREAILPAPTESVSDR
jgi:hypothetical protein